MVHPMGRKKAVWRLWLNGVSSTLSVDRAAPPWRDPGKLAYRLALVKEALSHSAACGTSGLGNVSIVALTAWSFLTVRAAR
jgi:hypothetical protein